VNGHAEVLPIDLPCFGGIYLDLKDASVSRRVSIVKKWDMTGQVMT
jgi:hypothetical protein